MKRNGRNVVADGAQVDDRGCGRDRGRLFEPKSVEDSIERTKKGASKVFKFNQIKTMWAR